MLEEKTPSNSVRAEYIQTVFLSMRKIPVKIEVFFNKTKTNIQTINLVLHAVSTIFQPYKGGNESMNQLINQ